MERGVNGGLVIDLATAEMGWRLEYKQDPGPVKVRPVVPLSLVYWINLGFAQICPYVLATLAMMIGGKTIWMGNTTLDVLTQLEVESTGVQNQVRKSSKKTISCIKIIDF